MPRKTRKDKGTTKPLSVKLLNPNRFPNSQVFKQHSRYPRHRLKQRILECNLIEYICHVCRSLPIWKGEKLILVLDHKNGINNDNRLSNLRFVCPNCDSQLPTFKSKNIRYQRSKSLPEWKTNEK